MGTRIVLGTASLLALALASTPLPCDAVSLAALVGYGTAYEYPLDPSGERAVAGSSPKMALEAEAAVRRQDRFAVVGSVRYLSFAGRVTLPKIPEAPNRRVKGSTLAASAGLRYSLTSLDRPAHLYLALAPAAVLLHTSVEEHGGMLGPPGPSRSSTQIAPGVALGTGFSVDVR